LNDPRNRKRLLWAAAGGAALIAALLFISAFAPSAHPGASQPVVRPDDQVTEATAADESGGGGFSLDGGDAVSLAWRVGLVVVIIAVAIVGLRWWGRRTSGPRSTTGFIRVLDTLAISNGRSIHLVALGDRVIAVGATAQQISLLNELTDDEAAELLARTAPGASARPGDVAGFTAELFQSLRRRESTPATRESVIGERAP
jgi:flagellar biogenesis protein FliO